MLVYAAKLRLRCAPGAAKILEVASRWLSRKGGGPISAQIVTGNHNLRLADGSQLRTWCETSAYPRLYALRLSHGDREVPGRQWVTELGVEDPGSESDIRATVLLETSEISARVLGPVLITRPLLIEHLLQECAPTSDTPGLTVRSLTPESAKAFEYVVTDERRAHPLIVISPTAAGEFVVDVARVRSLVAGLAEVVRIPPGADTFALADILGKEHVAWLGAVRVLFPPRTRGSERFVPRALLLAEQLGEIVAEGRSAEAEILSIVAHRMNLTNSRGHIRPDTVQELSLRREILRRRREAEEAGSTAELLPLYEEADRENSQKIRQLEDWNRELESLVDALEDEKRNLTSQNENLKAALGNARAAVAGQPGAHTVLQSREALLAAIVGTPSLEESLQVIEQLFAERLVILDSAWKSARDAATFQNHRKAFELLKTLVTAYWQALSDGRGDNEARKVFGSAYAARESETVEGNKRARALRTFNYEGKPIEMWKHLKIGTKPSAAETLRIHFEWDPRKSRIVIGHCGSHLDHG
jgi:hypothetical protein